MVQAGHGNLGVPSVQGVVGALGVNGTTGGCGVKRNRVESGTNI